MDQHARRLEHRTTTCSAWNIELSAIRRAKILASRESGCRVAHSRQVVRCYPMETLEHLDADSLLEQLDDSDIVNNNNIKNFNFLFEKNGVFIVSCHRTFQPWSISV